MCIQFENTVHYCSPAHGGWGVVRAGMLTPESYQLFVCPFACGHHGAIGAIEHGNKGRLSYIFIDEADIIMGSYEDLIINGVGELLDALEEKPKVLFVFVSCLDDLLGTDHEALEAALNEKYPIEIRTAHMNPIALDSAVPPAIGIQRNMYSLTDGTAQDEKTINLMGNFVPLDKEGEIYSFFKTLGIQKVNQISECTKFEAFKAFGNSKYNFVLRPEALMAAQDLEKRLSQSYDFLPVSYDLEEVEKQYGIMAERIAGHMPVDFSSVNLTEEKAKTLEVIARVRDLVKDTPIVIDQIAVCRPYNLAKALTQYGFNVATIYAEKLPKFEEESWQYLMAHKPECKVMQSIHHKRFVTNEKEVTNQIAIGYSAGYMSKARYVVDLVNDETLFGYAGIRTLMEKIEASYLNPKDLKTMIDDYGLVV